MTPTQTIVNKEKRKLAREQEQKRRKDIKLWYHKLKATKECYYCGESNPILLDFHHLKDKKYTISKMVNKPYSKKTILKEMDKCEIYCTRCHRLLHAGERKEIY